MARLSDIIEQFIKENLDNSSESELEIQRNELANYFSCAPSQINYVLTTRFTTEQGYYIESRRGGGGFIRIKRISIQEDPLINSIMDRIGNNITYDAGSRIIDILIQSEIITEREGVLIKLAINDRTLGMLGDNKNNVRAEILKAMISGIFI